MSARQVCLCACVCGWLCKMALSPDSSRAIETKLKKKEWVHMCLCVAPVRFMSRVCCFERQTTQCVLRPTLKQNNHESTRVTLVLWRYGEHIQSENRNVHNRRKEWVWKWEGKPSLSYKIFKMYQNLKQLIRQDTSAILQALIVLFWIIYSFILSLPCLFINNFPLSYLHYVALHYSTF